ncbi:MAG: secretin N-terminal domain-containing protein [Verrucomicrobiota bacterium]|jgi:type II secretory pathway component GspD/PulD (secretin)
MKTTHALLLLAAFAAGLTLRAAETNAAITAVVTNAPPAATAYGVPPTAAATNAPPAAGAATNTPAVAPPDGALTNAPPDTGDTNAPEPTLTDDGKLRLNLRNAPLELVLNYLSDAAGFVINLQTPVSGRVDMWSKEPVTKDEVVDLLNSALSRNGYSLIRNGRILTIFARDTVKSQGDLPVRSNRKLEDIPKNDEVVTEIIPVRHATASQLVKDLEQLLPTTSTMTANESANALVLTDTQADIHRVVEIVTALDGSISSVSALRVFPLQYADSKDLASIVKDLFATTSTGNNAGGGGRGQFFNMMRGGFPGMPGGNTGSSTGGGANTKVVAVADERSNSLVVSAPQDLMATIADMVKEIDQPVSDITELRVFHLVNADPSEVASQFTLLFPDPTQSSQQNQNQRFRMGGPGGFMNQATANSSEREKKQGRVLAVPDPRTSSIIVSAASTLMPQIAEMIKRLDESPGRKEKVFVYNFENMDPQDVQQILQDLFNRNSTMRTSTSSRNSMLNNNPLTTRETQNTQSTSSSTTSGFGSSSGRGGGF